MAAYVKYQIGYEDYSRHPYLRPVKKKEKEKYIEKQANLEEEIAQVEVEILFKDRLREQKQIHGLEKKLVVLQEELDSLKVLNALIEEQIKQEEEEMLMLLLAA